MDILERAILDKNASMIRFLLTEDPTLGDHVLSCGNTCREKMKELGIRLGIFLHDWSCMQCSVHFYVYFSYYVLHHYYHDYLS